MSKLSSSVFHSVANQSVFDSEIASVDQTNEHGAGLLWQLNKVLQDLKSLRGIIFASEEYARTPVCCSHAAVSGGSCGNFCKSRSQGEQTPINVDGVNLEDPQSKHKEQIIENTRQRKRISVLEQRLTRFAFKLGVLEKTASWLGRLAFVWAVFMLGGFISSISPYDFRAVSAVLITAGARKFSHSHGLACEHEFSIFDRVKKLRLMKISKALCKTKEALRSRLTRLIVRQKYEKIHQQLQSVSQIATQREHSKRTWSRAAIPILPMAQSPAAKRISTLLYYLQLSSAGVCIGFSVSRLIDQKFEDSANSIQNLRPALLIFYSLALAESFVFLIEMAYCEFAINCIKVLVKVGMKRQLHESDLTMVQQFFYDMYSLYLNGNFFDGLDMVRVDYIIEKLQSDIYFEQLGSVMVLAASIDNEDFAEDAMRRIETTPTVLHRLLEMLTWKQKTRKEIRLAAAKIIQCLVHHDSKRFKVVATPEALEGITSLLIPEMKGVEEAEDPEKELEFKKLKLLGLQILKNMAEEDINRVIIGTFHGILSMIVSFIRIENLAELSPEQDQLDISILVKSLQVLGLLSTAKGLCGKALRGVIREAVFLPGNLRDILKFGGSHPIFQEYAVDILTNLALDENLNENIGRTGGVLSSLLTIFLEEESEADDGRRALRVRTGEALSLLVLQNSNNCHRLLTIRGFSDTSSKSSTLKRLTKLFPRHPQVAISAVRIVKSICKYVNDTDRADMVALAPCIIEKAFEETGKMQEATLGLAARIVSFLQTHEYNAIYSQDFDRDFLLEKLMSFISSLKPSVELPQISIHTAELVIALIMQDEFFLEQFRKASLRMLWW